MFIEKMKLILLVPVFHQMEGVCLVEDNQDPVEELKKILTKIIDKLFPNCKYKMRDHHFPFTNLLLK